MPLFYSSNKSKDLSFVYEKLEAQIKSWKSPHKNGNRLYTPVACADLCKPLANGSLRFRSFERFNEAMVAKLAW